MADDFILNARITADSGGFTSAIDKAQESLNKMKDSVSKMGEKMDSSTEGIRNNLKNWGIDFEQLYSKGSGFFKNFGINIDKFAGKIGLTGPQLAILTTAILAAVKALQSLTEAAKEFDEVNSTLAKGTGATGKQLNGLNKSFQEMLLKGPIQDTKDLSQAMADLNTKFGVTGKNLETLTLNISEYANVVNQDATSSVKNVTDIVNKWGLELEQVPLLLDTLTVASQNSGASAQKLSDSLKSGQSVFSQFGMSITDSLSLLGAFEKSGVESQTVIMGMKTALAKFSNEGVDAKQGLEQLINMIQNGSNQTEILNKACEYFGTRAGAEMVSALQNNKTAIIEFKESLEGASGAVERTTEASKTLDNYMSEMGNVLKGTFAGLLSGFNKLEKDIMYIINDIVKAISLIIQPVSDIVGGVFSSLGEIIKSAWIEIKIILSAWTIGFDNMHNNFNTVVNGILSIFENLVNALKGGFAIIGGILTGDWNRAWIGAKLTFLSVIKVFSDYLSLLVNQFVIMMNNIIIQINKLAEKFDFIKSLIGGSSIELVPTVNISEITGLKDEVEKTKKELEKSTAESSKKVSDKITLDSKNTVDNISTDAKTLADKIESDAEKLAKELEKNQNKTKKGVETSIVGLSESWDYYFNNLKNNMEKNADDWTDVFQSIETTLTSVMKESIENIGKSLIEGGDAWENFGETALNAIASVLEAIAAQLSALAVTKAMMYSYGEAAVAAAGATAALFSAGVARGAAKSFTKTIESAAYSVEELCSNLINARKQLNSMVSSSTNVKSFVSNFTNVKNVIESTRIELSNAKNQLKTSYDLYEVAASHRQTEKWSKITTQRIWEVKASIVALEAAQQNYNAALQLVDNSLKNLNSTLDENEESIKQTIEGYKMFYSYINTSGITSMVAWKSQLSGISESLQDVYEDLSNVGKDMGETLLDSIADGANESDFVESMKDTIKRKVLEVVVYTESFKEQLAKVGAEIANAIANPEGVDWTNIREQISSVYNTAVESAKTVSEQLDKAFSTETLDNYANTLMDVSDMLSSLKNTSGVNISGKITGYASGTNDATAGVHLVGEYGPELMFTPAHSKIIPADETSKILSENKTTNVSYTFNSPTTLNPAEMIQKIRLQNIEMATSGIF